ncbi:unnamed protein product [Peronospora belbahrii]|uniref:Uncharacterized protein n=1 Tax=Peronospora belbahrii TaxID=622444 RepID=A0ABN8CWA9_9STRA|nr:unnamed protein product [Peronospora belbahrii]
MKKQLIFPTGGLFYNVNNVTLQLPFPLLRPAVVKSSSRQSSIYLVIIPEIPTDSNQTLSKLTICDNHTQKNTLGKAILLLYEESAFAGVDSDQIESVTAPPVV